MGKNKPGDKKKAKKFQAQRAGGLATAEKRGRSPDRTDQERDDRARRARQRRASKKARNAAKTAEEALAIMYEHKPIAEWDLEELAQGRPKDGHGHFKGPRPKWITAKHHEEIVKRFQKLLKQQMGTMMPHVLDVMLKVLQNEETWEDKDGRETAFRFPPAVKVKVAQILLEYALGKPTQKQEVEVEGKLTALLGLAIVNPDGSPSQGYIEADSWEEDEENNADLDD